MRYIYILILLSFLITGIPVSATVNWTFEGNTSSDYTIDVINSSGFEWAYWISSQNKSNATEFPIVAFAAGVATPWQDLFTDAGFGGLYIIIIWGVLMIMSYRSSGSVAIPAILGAISSAAVILLLPGYVDWTWMTLLLVLSVASLLYTTMIKED